VPALERALGPARLGRLHRRVGFTSMALLGAHLALTVAGHAVLAGAGPLGAARTLVTTLPGMLLALAATVALAVVAVSSVRAARRALRYETWRLLHLYAYLGVGLALPHQLWVGTDLAGGWARAYWWAAYGAAAGTLLTYRVLRPLARAALQRRLRVPPAVRNAAVTTATGVAVTVVALQPTSTGATRRDAAADPVPPGRAEVTRESSHHGPDVVVATGPAVESGYGPVQVRIRLQEGALLAAEAVAYPFSSAVDRVLNADAIPRLEVATVASQGEAVDTVSGATHTSEAYVTSLQAALDAAHR
jgi:DMSO/TMAO reductase YedYZ heme-binding membrane subunit